MFRAKTLITAQCMKKQKQEKEIAQATFWITELITNQLILELKNFHLDITKGQHHKGERLKFYTVKAI